MSEIFLFLFTDLIAFENANEKKRIKYKNDSVLNPNW
jgi:hypothetical protein